MLDHRGLDGAQATVLIQALDSHDVAVMHLVECEDARGHRLVPQLIPILPPQEHRASSTIPFRTNEPGAEQTELIAQVLSERGESEPSTELLPLAVDVKDDEVPRRIAAAWRRRCSLIGG